MGKFQTVEGRARLLDQLHSLEQEEERLNNERTSRRASRGAAEWNDPSRGTQFDDKLASCITSISKIRKVLSESEPVSAPAPQDTEQVRLGSIVTVSRCKNGRGKVKLHRFQLVGYGEGESKGIGTGATPKLQLLDYTADVGMLLLKKYVGDSVTYKGTTHEIVKIELPGKLRATKAA